jgi:hypothetical protein
LTASPIDRITKRPSWIFTYFSGLMMNRPFAFFVACVFTLQLCGFYTYYFFRNIQLHANVFERLEKNIQPEAMTMSAKAFNDNLVEENELRIEGKMFDIKKIDAADDSVKITVLRDIEEEILVEFLSDLISGTTHETNDNLPGQVLQIFQLTFLPSSFSFSVKDISPASSLAVLNSESPLTANTFLITPPPRA